jgi:acetyl-CoA carboxylase carboxyltransferase component
MNSATTAPAARMVPLTPSFIAAPGPRMVATWSGRITGTTVSQFANKANHSKDTWIWSGTENVLAFHGAAAAASVPSIMLSPPGMGGA